MSPPFSTDLSIRITDLNYGNHAGNDAVVGLLHEARIRFLAAHGWSELSCGGSGLIMRRLEVDFLRQLRHGDILRVEISPGDPGGARFQLRYQGTVGGEPAVAAVTEMGFFDYATGRPRRMPADVRERWFPSEPPRGKDGLPHDDPPPNRTP